MISFINLTFLINFIYKIQYFQTKYDLKDL